MFGTLRATRDDQTITRFRTRRVAILLAHLAFYLGRERTREELGEMLWPDQPDEAIRRNLRQALFSLRQTLEPPPLPKGSILSVQQSGVRFEPTTVQTDVAEFSGLVERARKSSEPDEQVSFLKKAVSLYRGELLPGFHDEWVLRERLRLEDLFLSCLRRLIQVSKRESQDEEAIAYLHLALRHEPLHEDWHTDLMARYLRSGRPKSALKQFDELNELLSTHLGCEPSAESRALADRALRESGPEVADLKTSLKSDDPLVENPLDKRTPTERTVRLPLQVTRFYGRRKEIDQVKQSILTRPEAITTLLGPAGTGKTRLSVEVARSIAESEGWSVWFVSLAELSKGSMVIDAIVDSMRARRIGASNPYEQIREAVVPHSSLLILDNLEHILEEAQPVISELVSEIPDLKILITSRQAVKLASETVFPIEPLPVPNSPGDLATSTREDLARISEYPSIQLFVDRSQALRPDVQLTPTNARTVAKICARLEGVPLAIELAAGLSGAFSPGQMLRHLERRLTALASRRRDASPRHRSLRAAIDYSYDSLGEDRQRLFSALSVFRGGFNVDSARKVCFGGDVPTSFDEGDPDERCLSLILDLQERSLLMADSGSETLEPRFRMLESFRQYGEEQLSEEDQRALRALHATYFLTNFAPPGPETSSEARTQHHYRVEAEYENFMAALDFLLQTRALESCIQLLGHLSFTWLNRGPTVAERSFIRQLANEAENSRPSPGLHVQLLRMLGTTYIRSSEYMAAYETCERALAIAIEAGDRSLEAVCYSAMATCAGFAGLMDRCLELNEQALALLQENDLWLQERVLLGIGAVYWSRADPKKAEEYYLQARKVSEKMRGGEPDALLLVNLARVSLDQDRFDEAVSLVGDALRISRRLHDGYTVSQCLALMARYHWLKGNLGAALTASMEALDAGRNTAFEFLTLHGVRVHALILMDAGDAETALTLLASTSSIAKMHRRFDDSEYAAALDKAKSKLGADQFERAWAQGLTMSADQALLLAFEHK
jgi:predicted ATPase/DNA-binding SARP family transcriptional activator